MSISTLFNISLAFVCISTGAYVLMLTYIRWQNYRQASKAADEYFKRLIALTNEKAKPGEANGGEWK